MSVNITIGKDQATITKLIGDIVVIRYQGKEANVDISKGWNKLSGTLAKTTINKIKKAFGEMSK